MTLDGEREDRARGARMERMRMRYAPRFRPGGGIFSMAPWLDLVLVFVFYLLIETRVTVHPGIVVELPTAPISDGIASGEVLLLTMARGADGAMREVVYVDDLRYVIGQQGDALAGALRDMSRSGEEGLVLYADRRVPHETLTGVMELARAAGFKRVGLAMQQLQPVEDVPRGEGL